MRSIFIKDISFTAVTGAQKHMFAFISKDERLDRTLCHVYQSGAKAHEICTCIGEAFRVAHEEMKARAGNPFAPLSKERERLFWGT